MTSMVGVLLELNHFDLDRARILSTPSPALEMRRDTRTMGGAVGAEILLVEDDQHLAAMQRADDRIVGGSILGLAHIERFGNRAGGKLRPA